MNATIAFSVVTEVTDNCVTKEGREECKVKIDKMLQLFGQQDAI